MRYSEDEEDLGIMIRKLKDEYDKAEYVTTAEKR